VAAKTADFEALCNRTVPYHGDLLRNIKSIRIPQALFDDLADSTEEAGVAVAVEALSRIGTEAPVITRPFDYGSVITYSFATAHWQQSRFSDGARYGVWYGALDVKTTVYETLYHWHRFLMDSFPQEDRVIQSDRRVFDVRCDGLLIDLRGRERQAPALVSRESYALTQALGSYLVRHEQNGLLMKSARCEGVNAAIFQAARLCKVRDHAQLTYKCSPRHDRVAVERTRGRNWLTIRPSELG
jgi:hypothetical protein